MFSRFSSGSNLVGIFIALVVFRLSLAVLAPLTPQEAYYWSWSQYPSLSYFDHPPLASYSIALTTALLGDTVFGIKLAAVLWSLGSNLLLARLVIDMFADRKLAVVSLLGLNLSLLYGFLSIVTTPDAPLLFGWIGTVWALWRVRQTGLCRWWWLLGLFMGIAWMGKYAGILLLGVVGSYLLLDPLMRRWLLKPQPYISFLIALLVFSPVLWWNMEHEWVSLAFQSTRRLNQMNELKPRFFLLLLVTQTLLLTPYLIWLSLSAGVYQSLAVFRRRIDSASLLLLLSAAVPILVFGLASFRSNAKMNYLLPAWWSLLILGMHQVLTHPKGLRYIKFGLTSTAIMLLASLAILLLPNLPLGELNTWSGWREAAVKTDALSSRLSAQGQKNFVFSPNYKISSLIWFHRPSQTRTYAQDIVGTRALQFDYFPQETNLRGQTGIYVVSDQTQSKADMTKVAALFDSLELAETITTKTNGRNVRSVQLWVGRNYKGRLKQDNQSSEPQSP